MPGLAVLVHAGDLHQAHDADREHQISRMIGARRRRNVSSSVLFTSIHLRIMVVSTMRMTTDTTFASSAPADNDTTLTIASSDSGPGRRKKPHQRRGA